MTVYRFGPAADWDAIREGACSYCGEPLEVVGGFGVCAGDPDIGFRVFTLGGRPVLEARWRDQERMWAWWKLANVIVNPVAATFGDRHTGAEPNWWRHPDPSVLHTSNESRS